MSAWWEQAIALTPRVVAAGAAPEPAHLVRRGVGTCPPERAGELETSVRTAFGTAPSAAELDKVVPAGAGRVDGTAEPLASWLRVRRLQPAGPADPCTAPAPAAARTATALAAEDLAELAEARGPAAAAAALAADEDADGGGCAMGLHRLVAAGPAAWTADVPAVLNALKARRRSARSTSLRPPVGALAGAVTAALGLVRALDRPAAADRPATAGRADGQLLADQALFDLLTTAWRTDTALDAGPEQEALAHLHALAAELPRPAPDASASPAAGASAPAGDATGPPPAAADHRAPAGSPEEPELLGSDPRVRALGCLPEYAIHHARTHGEMPAKVLQAVAVALPASAGQDAVARAIGGTAARPALLRPRRLHHRPPRRPVRPHPRPALAGRRVAAVGDRPARRCSRPWIAPT